MIAAISGICRADAAADLRRAAELADKGSYSEAVTILQDVVLADPKIAPTAQMRMGQFLCRDKKYPEAIAALKIVAGPPTATGI
jgi:predicted negative regulator of RcsB-dependent stress response